jgi:hypothetical protein
MNQGSVPLLATAALIVIGSCPLASAATSALPPAQHAGDITYLSGGVGSDQSAAIKGVMRNYPLVLEFVGKTNSGNEYLADVPVQISDTHGKDLLNTQTGGPYMLLSLPHGQYTVTAMYKGKTERRAVNITAATHAREMFAWPM